MSVGEVHELPSRQSGLDTRTTDEGPSPDDIDTNEKTAEWAELEDEDEVTEEDEVFISDFHS